jgi:glycerophosphoryl diester phosphodiesterase
VARTSHRWGDWRRRVLDGLAAHRWDALMAQHRLIDAELVAAVSARDARVYGWTLDDRPRIDALRGLGVHGLVSGDPRLFG